MTHFRALLISLAAVLGCSDGWAQSQFWAQAEGPSNGEAPQIQTRPPRVKLQSAPQKLTPVPADQQTQMQRPGDTASDSDAPSAAASGVTQPAQPAIAETPLPPQNFSACRNPKDIIDRDGDVARNAAALSAGDLCLQMDVFREAGLTWTLQIVQNRKSPDGFFWFVPHDNENDAFDSAVYGVKTYGGTMVAVETNGSRFNAGQDPNRNFDANTGRKCREQLAPSPLFTQHVMRWRSEGARIFALHTNERGHNGDGQGGTGGISIARPLAGTRAFRAKLGKPPLGRSPDDTVTFVASKAPPEADANLMAFVDALRDNQINVLYETVSAARNDCSFSNYAALVGIRNYINIEVIESDGATQRDILNRIVKLMPPDGIGPVVDSPARLPAAPPESGDRPPEENGRLIPLEERQPQQGVRQSMPQRANPAGQMAPPPGAINSMGPAAPGNDETRPERQQEGARQSAPPRLPTPGRKAGPDEQGAATKPSEEPAALVPLEQRPIGDRRSAPQPLVPRPIEQPATSVDPADPPSARDPADRGRGTSIFDRRFWSRESGENENPRPREIPSEPSRQRSKVTMTTPSVPSNQGISYYAQLGSPTNKADAQRLQEDRRREFPELFSRTASSIQPFQDARAVLHFRVLLGPFTSQSGAESACATLLSRANAPCSLARL